MKKHLSTLFLVLVALIGAGLIAYPTVADLWNRYHQSRAVASYTQAVASLDPKEYQEKLKKAAEYNEKLAQSGFKWNMKPEDIKVYEEMLSVNGNGVMGYIDIPKIDVKLPIYHGVDEAVLQIAIGHLEGTSLPVGGPSTHTVLSGHRGLPSARLFTDIDKLVIGDTWTLNVMDRTLTYEVDQISVVEPSDLSKLEIEKGKDFCTLVTCTPYGINTHRLLVRGRRIQNAQGDAEVVTDALEIRKLYVLIAAYAVYAVILLFIWIIHSARVRRRRKKSAALRGAQSGNEEKSGYSGYEEMSGHSGYEEVSGHSDYEDDEGDVIKKKGVKRVRPRRRR